VLRVHIKVVFAAEGGSLSVVFQLRLVLKVALVTFLHQTVVVLVCLCDADGYAGFPSFVSVCSGTLSLLFSRSVEAAPESVLGGLFASKLVFISNSLLLIFRFCFFFFFFFFV